MYYYHYLCIFIYFIISISTPRRGYSKDDQAYRFSIGDNLLLDVPLLSGRNHIADYDDNIANYLPLVYLSGGDHIPLIGGGGIIYLLSSNTTCLTQVFKSGVTHSKL